MNKVFNFEKFKKNNKESREKQREEFLNNLKINLNVMYANKIHTVVSIDRDNKKVMIRPASDEFAEHIEAVFDDISSVN